MQKLIAVCTCCALVTFAATTHAQVIAADPFNYPSGSSMAGMNGGGDSGFSGPWGTASGSILVQSGSLTAGALLTSGNSAAASGSLGANITRPLTNSFGPAGGEVLWFSIVMKGLGVAAGTSQGNFALFDGSQTTTGGVAITTGTTSSGNYSLADSGTQFTASPSTTSSSQQALLVVRLSFGAVASDPDVANLYVNPPIGGPTPPSPDVTINLNITSAINQIRVTGSGTGTPYQFDEFRLGNAFIDVTPVPEPTSLLLTGFVGFGGWIVRRRRQARANRRP